MPDTAWKQDEHMNIGAEIGNQVPQANLIIQHDHGWSSPGLNFMEGREDQL